MATISTVTDRSDGEVLTAAKYNTDHGVHETNATNLNTDKVEDSIFEGQHLSSGVHEIGLRSSINLATGDEARFDSVVATGDRSYFASADILNTLTVTSDVIASRVLASGDVSAFATADFAGAITADYLTIRRNSSATFTSSDLGKVFLDMMPNAFIKFQGVELAISQDVNVESIGDNGDGRFQINFSATLDSDAYQIFGTAGPDDSSSVIVTVITQDIGFFDINTRTAGDVAEDPKRVYLSVFGGKIGLP